MYQKDFILRLIEEFFRFLSIILKLKAEGKLDDAMRMIDEVALNLLRIRTSEIDAVSIDELPEFVVNRQFQEQQIEALARLLKERGDIHDEQNNRFSAIADLEKSLILFEIVKGLTNTYSQEREEDMTNIRYHLLQLKE